MSDTNEWAFLSGGTAKASQPASVIAISHGFQRATPSLTTEFSDVDIEDAAIPEPDTQENGENIGDGLFFPDSALDGKEIPPPAEPQYVTDIPRLTNTFRMIERGRGSWPDMDSSNFPILLLEGGLQLGATLPLADLGSDTVSFNHNVKDASLGGLEKLPLEVLHMVLGYCTFESLLCLRRVNRRAATNVHSLPLWRTLLQYNPALLLRMIKKKTSTSQFITANQLNGALNQVECDGCGQPGERINLLSCERFCRYCAHEYRFQIFRASEAMEALSLPDSLLHHVKKLPHVVAEHVYDVESKHFKGDPETISFAWKNLPAFVNHSDPHRMIRNHPMARQSRYTRVRSDYCHDVVEDLRPRTPWLIRDRATTVRRLDWGFRCFACENPVRRWLSQKKRRPIGGEDFILEHPRYMPLQPHQPWHYRLHTEESFRAHLFEMGDINTAGWHKRHGFYEEEREYGEDRSEPCGDIMDIQIYYLGPRQETPDRDEGE
ncbi:hypothetical protein V8F20_003991 [Naviculisporaceae sp. PSN 640]